MLISADFFFRENSNIGESNAFTHEQINGRVLAVRLQSTNGVNAF
jgi:hypothetical protein